MEKIKVGVSVRDSSVRYILKQYEGKGLQR